MNKKTFIKPKIFVNQLEFTNIGFINKYRLLRKIFKSSWEIDFNILLKNSIKDYEENIIPVYPDSSYRNKNLIIIFETWNNIPSDWVLTLFKYFKIPFVYTWLNTDTGKGFIEKYNKNGWEQSKELDSKDIVFKDDYMFLGYNNV